jgi:hypothetical protein
VASERGVRVRLTYSQLARIPRFVKLMSNEKFIYHPFKDKRPVVKILLKKGQHARTTEDGKEVGGPEYGTLPGQQVDDALIPARQFNVSVYDLGTRMRSVAPGVVFDGLRYRPFLAQDVPEAHGGNVTEYVEIDFAALGTFVHNSVIPPGDHLLLDSAAHTHFNQALLGQRVPVLPGHEHDTYDKLDPFSFAIVNGSSRQLPVCMDITRYILGIAESDVPDPREGYPPVARKGQITNLWLPNSGQLRGSDYRATDGIHPPSYSIGPVLKPAIIKKYDSVKEDEAESAENWSPVNVEMAGVTTGAKAKKHQVDGGAGQGLAFGYYTGDGFGGIMFDIVGEFGQGVLNYEGFSTWDTTNFKITNGPRFDASETVYTFKGRDNRIYLRPVLIGYRIYTDAGTHRSWAGRRPVYPNSFHATDCLVRRTPDADFAHAPSGATLQYLALENVLPPGSLVAAIAQGSKIFYIWRKTAREPNYSSFLIPSGPIGECS